MMMSTLVKAGKTIGKTSGSFNVPGILIRFSGEVVLSIAANMTTKKISKAIEDSATKRK